MKSYHEEAITGVIHFPKCQLEPFQNMCTLYKNPVVTRTRLPFFYNTSNYDYTCNTLGQNNIFPTIVSILTQNANLKISDISEIWQFRFNFFLKYIPLINIFRSG
jgi:hypothetical protein